MIFLIDSGIATDTLSVLDANSSGLDGRTMGAPSLNQPEMISFLTPNNSDSMEFPVMERSMAEEDVEELKHIFNSRVEPDNMRIRDVAIITAFKYSGNYSIEQVSAIYDYLKNGDGSKKGWGYLPDPRDRAYFNYANETVRLGERANCSGAGDSYDFAILMSSLVESLGGTTRIILAYNNTTKGHAYAEVYLGHLDASDSHVKDIIDWLKLKYDTNEIYAHIDIDTQDAWLNLDWLSDERGISHPGGSFYQGERFLVIPIREQFLRTPLGVPDNYLQSSLLN
jgi:hypothetical protein